MAASYNAVYGGCIIIVAVTFVVAAASNVIGFETDTAQPTVTGSTPTWAIILDRIMFDNIFKESVL